MATQLITDDGVVITTGDGDPISLSVDSIFALPRLGHMPANAVPVTIAFTDEVGNPLPAETLVLVFSAYSAPTSDQIVTSAYTGTSSSVTANLTLGAAYRVTYVGNRVRGVAASVFSCDSTYQTIALQDYRSPILSQDAFAQEQMDMWTRGMVGVTAPPVFATIVAKTMASMLSYVQAEIQQLSANLILPSCVSSAVDSWAADYFGKQLPRFPSEPDSVYVPRIMDALSPASVMLAAIAAKTRAYLVLQATYGQHNIFALDTSGALDTYGGLDDAGTIRAIPTVSAFDWQSDPVNSQAVGLLHGQVCILFSYPGILQQGFVLGQAVLGTSALNSASIKVTTAPTPALDTYVRQYIKSAGIDIVYADNRT